MINNKFKNDWKDNYITSKQIELLENWFEKMDQEMPETLKKLSKKDASIIIGAIMDYYDYNSKAYSSKQCASALINLWAEKLNTSS